MQPVKRVEIVTVAVERQGLVQKLKEIGITGYTILPTVEGFGDRGLRAGDELTDVFKNIYVLVACSEEQARAIAEAVRPILRKFGGICLVSDATSVRPTGR